VRAGRIPAVVALSLATVGTGRAADPPTLRVEASREGFHPGTLRLRKGETVRIVLTSADDTHCFAVDALRIEKRAVPGRETVFDVTPDEAGSFSFYCCLETGKAAEKEWGELVVTE
jgi:heme/copper-type cytochrome/quinol oxidase subunit 2